MEVTVSVIMSVLNGEKTVSRAIISILEQTYKSFEFIICDDGSSDNTWDILTKWQKKDARIILLRNSGKIGLAASLNRCLEIARGEIICRQDADDISSQTRISKMLDYIQEKSLPYAGCAVRIIDDDGEWSRRSYPETITRHDIVKANPFFHATLLLRREAIDSVNGYRVAPETSRTEDYDLIMRLAAKGIVGCNYQEYLYTVHEDRKEYKNKHKRKTRLQEFRTRRNGYRIMQVPVYEYIYLLKPLVLCLVPLSLLTKLKEIQWKRKG